MSNPLHSSRPSQPSKRDRPDAVPRTLLQYHTCTRPRRQDVLLEVLQVDLFPDIERGVRGLLVGQLGVALEVGAGVAKRRIAQRQEAFDVPLAQDRLVRVDIDGEVE